MRELVDGLFAGDEAWIVGGAVRDRALRRPLIDLDVALREPEQAARIAAERLLDRFPQAAEKHIHRWLGGRSEYLKA